MVKPVRCAKVENAGIAFVQQQIAGQRLMRIHRRAHLLTAHIKLIIGKRAQKTGAAHPCLKARPLTAQCYI